MKRTRRHLVVSLTCLIAWIVCGAGDRRVSAAGNSPAVSIRRNPVFQGAVLTGDFNGDGIGDLVGSTRDPAHPSAPAVITVALGQTNGSLGAPKRTTVPGTVLAVGDFNADGTLDLLVGTTVANAGQPRTDLQALRGNGDGTFAAPSLVTFASTVTLALIADLDGDGKSDVVAAVNNDGDSSMVILKGNGDFTFTFARFLVGDDPVGATVADLNGDGKPDLVTANGEFNTLSIFLNQGALQFTASQLTVPHNLNDVAAGDLNGDGRIDLVVASSNSNHPGYDVGYATVLLGGGNGTFASPIDYPTAPGAWRVVIGDFNRDGIVDIATANRSSIYYDALCSPWQTWDSISIFPGLTAGIGARSDFSIGNQMRSDDPHTDRNTVTSLVIGDLNGDHAPDLVVSNGTVFLNHAADPNWAPTVDAGPNQVVTDPDDHFVHLFAKASDVDQDMLTYSWFDSTGDFVPQVPSPCFSPHTLGVHTYTVVVDDGHGHTATDSMQVDFGADTQRPVVSVTAPAAGEVVPAAHPYVIRWTVTPGTEPIDQFDLMFSPDDGFTTSFIAECTHLAGSATSCQWNNPPVTERGKIQLLGRNASGTVIAATYSGLFAVRATTTSGLPSGWSHADIGSVGAAGSASYSGGVFTVKGSGADIWGAADEFHYAYLNSDATGNHPTLTMTAHVDSVQNVNQWTKAGVMIRNSLNAGSAQASVFISPSKGIVFQRRLAQGGASVSTQGPVITAPVWVRVTMEFGGSGETVRGYYRINANDPWTLLGQDTTSSFWNQPLGGLAVTSHADGTVAAATFSNVSVSHAPDWSGADTIGPYDFYGGAIDNNDGSFTVTGRGADIWNTTDQFQFLSESCSGNCTITARVRSLTNTNAWSKAGVMFRETLDGGSRQADMIVSPSKGAAMQHRATTGGVTAQDGTVVTAAPAWVRVTRAGNVYTGYWSSDGVNFAQVGSATIAMADTVLVGLAVTSHTASASATAVFDNVTIQQP